jgi:hypothetical protein
MKYSGIDPANLADLVAIAVSLKNKYGIMPFCCWRARASGTQRASPQLHDGGDNGQLNFLYGRSPESD